MSSVPLVFFQKFDGALVATVKPDNATDKSVSWKSGKTELGKIFKRVFPNVIP